MDLKSRKLVCAFVCFLSATLFVILGKADFTGWADFVKYILGIYVVGNVGEHYTNKIGEK